MARRLIAYTQNGVRLLRNVYTDRTGEPLIYVDENETKAITIDLTGYLDTGETISSVTSTTESLTADVTLTSPTIAVDLSDTTSGTDGTATLTITLSSGEIMRLVLHARRMNRFTDEANERDYV